MSRTLSSTHDLYESFTCHVVCQTGKTVGVSRICTVFSMSRTLSNNRDWYESFTYHELYQHATNFLEYSQSVWIVYISRGVSLWQGARYESYLKSHDELCHELYQRVTNSINMSRTLSSPRKVYDSFTYHVACQKAKTVGESHIWRIMTLSRTLSSKHEFNDSSTYHMACSKSLSIHTHIHIYTYLLNIYLYIYLCV